MLQSPLRAGLSLKKLICAATLLVIVSAKAPAWAGTILDLSIGNRGVFAYSAGERHPRFWGGAIKVGELMYGNNDLSIFRGRLSFSSGSFLRSSGSSLFWGAGGKLSVSGCVDLDHGRKCDNGDFNGTLMTGKFLDAELINRNGKEILEAQIVDQINPQLAALLHLSSAPHTGELELMLVQLRDGRWWVRDGVQGGLLKNNPTVPETSSIWLLGAGLVGLAVACYGTMVRKDA